MDATITGLIVAAIGSFAAAVGLFFTARQLGLEKKLRTLEYVTNQFDKVAETVAREELRLMGSDDILTHVSGDPHKTQVFLEWVYAFNRIGAGIYKKALDESVVFQIWTPRWFEGHWKRFEALVNQEKSRRGEKASEAYLYFQWLGKEKCPNVQTKYPDYLKRPQKRIPTGSTQ